MKRTVISLAAAAAALAGPVLAEVVAPSAVSWVDEVAIETSLSGAPGNVESGKVLMDKGLGNCIACHAVTDLSELQFHGTVGPSLDGVADRWSEAELRGIVSDAKRMFDGTVMPSFYRTEGYTRPGNGFTGKAVEGDVQPLLTAQEIEDLVAYLLTLKE